jgi:Protein of unknown function (DUF1360)
MSIVTAPPFTLLLMAIFAVWRVTHLLAAEDGPGDLFARLRGAAGEGAIGRLLDCFYCLSLWIAAPFAWLLAVSWRDGVLTWLALSGAAVLLERLTARAAPAMWREDTDATDATIEPLAAMVKSDKEKDHVVLR